MPFLTGNVRVSDSFQDFIVSRFCKYRKAVVVNPYFRHALWFAVLFAMPSGVRCFGGTSSVPCPAPATGAFTGCYYDNMALSGNPVFVRTDNQINFYWGNGSPDASLQPRNFSARWQGNFMFSQGNYTLSGGTVTEGVSCAGAVGPCGKGGVGAAGVSCGGAAGPGGTGAGGVAGSGAAGNGAAGPGGAGTGAGVNRGGSTVPASQVLQGLGPGGRDAT